ncbi:NADH-quinone oxidoreductase subunit J [Peterkaempfera sp. SMS 1(5)a]|uniref:NADH-quinone oxidoreductase subunit J family protein n=1 Tax=Peterkaempfera podocarpi TaxID=3232308 RepID=UPI00366CCF8A
MTAAPATSVLLAAGPLSSQGHSFLSPTGVEIVFVLVGLAVLGSAVLSVSTRQLVHAALWLVVALGGLAVEFLLLTAEFIAWVQVLIYIGSIVVLVLFGLMLTKAPIGRSPDADSGNRPVALGVAVVAAATLVTLVVDAFRTTWVDLGAGAGSAEVTGVSLFRHWVLPFEALSVLLLAALVGAVVLSRSEKARTALRPPRPRPGRATSIPRPAAPGPAGVPAPANPPQER